VDPHAVGELMHDTTHNELDPSETEVHLPTRTDCADGCVYCYYCIAQELSALAKERQGAEGDERERKPKGWECLRCGGEVFACDRVVEDRIEPPPNTTDTH
jgi:peroxin-2